MRPVIGLTLDDEHARPGMHVLRDDYVRSVQRAGALALVLPPGPAGDAPALLDCVDGLLLTGGVDIDPELFGQAPHPKIRRVDRERDDLEIALVREALRRDLPILAICRGIQVLNVAAGGTLLQDLPSQLRGGERHDCPEPRTARVHRVAVESGTQLHRILREGHVPVNSFHHQAVDRVGKGCVVTARCEDDDVVEGLEMPGQSFVVGVQWHPESFWDSPDSFQGLFDAQADACRRRAESPTPTAVSSP